MLRASVGELLGAAGWTMIPLYVCSVVAVAAIVRTAWRFHPRRVGVVHPVSPSDDEGAPVLARVLARATAATERGPDAVERAALEAAGPELDELSGDLTVLAFLVQAAPLLGLLGTVFGMVDLFGSLEQGGARVDAALLASGIWKALLTTAAGLIVAIPSLGAHMWFERRLERLRVAIEAGLAGILDEAAGP